MFGSRDDNSGSNIFDNQYSRLQHYRPMKKVLSSLTFIALFLFAAAQNKTAVKPASLQVKTANGTVEGEWLASGVRIYKGIPYAAPPVGDLRWKEPQPVKNWKGIRKANQFGDRSFQRNSYKDMVFRSKQQSEDCLYLNVWTNAIATNTKLPVLVYFHGGGLSSGDGSEYRYDGENMATKGVIVVTVNYRLGIFGFFSHPELTKESSHHASGNYGFLDQRAALLWVQKNIAAFGGDPAKVTIGGQSAGSMSVSAQMASPISSGLFARAMGESGSLLGALMPGTLSEAEQTGNDFAKLENATSIDALRKIPADKLFEDSKKSNLRFSTSIDGYFLSRSPMDIYATGQQADVPLLAGWNSAEVTYHNLLGSEEPTPENYKNALQKVYGDRAEDVLKYYPGSTNEEVVRSATDLASDRYIVYSTWKWLDLHGKTNGHAVYRYLYTHNLPPLKGDSNVRRTAPLGAPHSAELPFAFGNLRLINDYNWSADDYKVSDTMQGFFVNFIKTGDPNGEGLPKWSGLQASIPKVMLIDTNAHQEPEKNLKRYQFMDGFYYK